MEKYMIGCCGSYLAYSKNFLTDSLCKINIHQQDVLVYMAISATSWSKFCCAGANTPHPTIPFNSFFSNFRIHFVRNESFLPLKLENDDVNCHFHAKYHLAVLCSLLNQLTRCNAEYDITNSYQNPKLVVANCDHSVQHNESVLVSYYQQHLPIFFHFKFSGGRFGHFGKHLSHFKPS